MALSVKEAETICNATPAFFEKGTLQYCLDSLGPRHGPSAVFICFRFLEYAFSDRTPTNDDE